MLHLQESAIYLPARYMPAAFRVLGVTFAGRLVERRPLASSQRGRVARWRSGTRPQHGRLRLENEEEDLWWQQRVVRRWKRP